MRSAILLAILLAASPLNADLVVVLGTEWCGACKPMKPIVEKLAEEGHPILYVDAERYCKEVKRLGIVLKAYPTTVVLKDKKVIKQIPGRLNREQLLNETRSIKKQRSRAGDPQGEARRTHTLRLPQGTGPHFSDDAFRRGFPALEAHRRRNFNVYQHDRTVRAA